MTTANMTDTEERISNLEVRLSYQDKMLHDLDEVVQSFSARVLRLERKIADLSDSVGSQEIGPGNDRPPHY